MPEEESCQSQIGQRCRRWFSSFRICFKPRLRVCLRLSCVCGFYKNSCVSTSPFLMTCCLSHLLLLFFMVCVAIALAVLVTSTSLVPSFGSPSLLYYIIFRRSSRLGLQSLCCFMAGSAGVLDSSDVLRVLDFESCFIPWLALPAPWIFHFFRRSSRLGLRVLFSSHGWQCRRLGVFSFLGWLYQLPGFFLLRRVSRLGLLSLFRSMAGSAHAGILEFFRRLSRLSGRPVRLLFNM